MSWYDSLDPVERENSMSEYERRAEGEIEYGEYLREQKLISRQDAIDEKNALQLSLQLNT